jgi:glyoxylase-like metal-dependent hydrolase (beta-lactamase superfamily II)
MVVRHINCATFCPVGQALVNGHGSPFKRGKLVVHCQVIESSDGLILVDTGLGTRDIADPASALPGATWQALNQARLDVAETAVVQLRKLGYDPADVRHIVLTHLDFDHAGGLADFPHAQVHAFELEYLGAMARPLPRDRMRYAPAQWAHGVDWRLYDTAGDKWFGFDSVRTIPGVEQEVLLVPLLGHSRGHCGVAINTGKDWLFNVGDAAFHHGEIDSPRRRCPPGLRAYQNVFQYDRRARLFNQQRLRDLALSPNANVRIVCSHDPAMMVGYAGHGPVPALHGVRAHAHPGAVAYRDTAHA